MKCILCGREIKDRIIPMQNKGLEKFCDYCISVYNLTLKDTWAEFYYKMKSYGAEYGLEHPTYYHP